MSLLRGRRENPHLTLPGAPPVLLCFGGGMGLASLGAGEGGIDSAENGALHAGWQHLLSLWGNVNTLLCKAALLNQKRPAHGP